MRQVYALLGLVKRWGAERVDAACARALEAEAVSVALIGRMLERATENDAAGATVAERGHARPLRPRRRALRRRPTTRHSTPREVRRERPGADHLARAQGPAARVKLGRCLDTLPERLALARTGAMGHAEFLELVLADEVTRRETTSATCGPGPPGSTRPCAWRTGTTPPRSPTTARRGTSCARCASSTAATTSSSWAPSGWARPSWPPPSATPPSAAATACSFERCDRMLRRLRASRLDNSHDAEMRKLLRVDLLVLDDFALQPLDAARHRRRLRARSSSATARRPRW